MIPYFSYWSGGYRKPTSDVVLLSQKLSARLAKKHYGEAHLITDSNGAEIFKDIGFTSIEVLDSLNNLNPEFSNTWSISKILVYEKIVEKEAPFIHIDYDVFLFKPLPSFIEKSSVFAQSPENDIWEYYEMEKFYKLCPEHKDLKHFDGIANFASNFGIFGGTDLELIREYVNSAKDLAFDEKNYSFWTSNENPFKWGVRRSTILEQYLLNVIAQKRNTEISYLFKKWPNNKQAEDVGYTHLMLAKDNPVTKVKLENILEIKEQERDLIEIKRKEGAPLIISFSSTGLPREAHSEFEWTSTFLEIPDVNIICVRDRNKMFYHKGIYNFSNSIEETAEKLKSIIGARYKNSKLIFTGMCGGGFGALIFGSILKADRIIVTSPRTFVLGDEDDGFWGANNRGLTSDDFNLKYSDISKLQFDPKTKIVSMVSTDDKGYFKHSMKILKMNNVTTTIYNNLGHGMGGFLKYSGEFKRLIEAAIQK